MMDRWHGIEKMGRSLNRLVQKSECLIIACITMTNRNDDILGVEIFDNVLPL